MQKFVSDNPKPTLDTTDYIKNMNNAVKLKLSSNPKYTNFWNEHADFNNLVKEYHTEQTKKDAIKIAQSKAAKKERDVRQKEGTEYKSGPDAYLERKYNEFINLRPDEQLNNLNELLEYSHSRYYKKNELIYTLTQLGEIYDKSPSIFSVFSSKKPTKEEIKNLVAKFYNNDDNKTTIDKNRQIPQSIKNIFAEVKKDADVLDEVATTKVVDTPSDNELTKELTELEPAVIQKGTSFDDGEEKEEAHDLDDEEKQDETIKIKLQNMLTKLPLYTVEKTEQEYRKEYIDINKDGELFKDEEEKEVHSVGGRTQKKKKKRVQNRRRQKTIKNKV